MQILNGVEKISYVLGSELWKNFKTLLSLGKGIGSRYKT